MQSFANSEELQLFICQSISSGIIPESNVKIAAKIPIPTTSFSIFKINFWHIYSLIISGILKKCRDGTYKYCFHYKSQAVQLKISNKRLFNKENIALPAIIKILEYILELAGNISSWYNVDT